MTNQQKEFLLHHVIRGLNYPVVTKLMNVHPKTLSIWYEELRTEREKIATIRRKWTKNKFTPEFEEYYNWFISRE